jgi:hypothetical protein
VLVDMEGGNNLLYLPLDQLMQRRPAPLATAEPPPASAAPPAGAAVPRSRERDGAR